MAVRIANIYETKTHLSQFVEDVSHGDEIIIAKANKPIAKIVAYKNELPKIKLGLLKGKIKFSEDFDTLPDEVTQAFNGEAA